MLTMREAGCTMLCIRVLDHIISELFMIPIVTEREGAFWGGSDAVA